MPTRYYLTLPEVTDVADTGAAGDDGVVSLGGRRGNLLESSSLSRSLCDDRFPRPPPSFVYPENHFAFSDNSDAHLIKESEQTLPTLESGRK